MKKHGYLTCDEFAKTLVFAYLDSKYGHYSATEQNILNYTLELFVKFTSSIIGTTFFDYTNQNAKDLLNFAYMNTVIAYKRINKNQVSQPHYVLYNQVLDAIKDGSVAGKRFLEIAKMISAIFLYIPYDEDNDVGNCSQDIKENRKKRLVAAHAVMNMISSKKIHNKTVVSHLIKRLNFIFLQEEYSNINLFDNLVRQNLQKMFSDAQSHSI